MFSITSQVPVFSHHQMSPTAGEALDGSKGVFLESSSDNQGFWKSLPNNSPSQEVRFPGSNLRRPREAVARDWWWRSFP